ncbi:MAG: hypothetical protein AAF993_00255 [Pseudomonadota bacterium]
MKLGRPIIAWAICALFSISSVHAAPMTYNVSSTDVVNCSGAPHGFWTNQLQLGGGSCDQYYNYQEGSTLAVDTMAGEAVLDATAVNPYGVTAVINFTWENLVPYSDWTGVVKNGGGGNPADWLYFASGSGSASFFYAGSLLGTIAMEIMPNTALQLGLGANDKDGAYGASSWLKPLVYSKTRVGKHWDFNMNLSAASVPAGGSVITMLLALFALGALRRRNLRSAA